MRHRVILLGLVVGATAMVAETRGQEANSTRAEGGSTAAVREQEEPAIRRVVDAFAKAYNAGDSKSLAGLFTSEAEIVSDDGRRAQGRIAIEQVFAQIFKEHPKARMEIAVGTIRMVSPELAIEDGTATVTSEPGEPAERTRYLVVHVKQEGQWRMASARDVADEPLSAEERLKQLEGLIGDWIDESPDGVIMTSYRWTDNHCFIVGEFTVHIHGRPAMTGTHRIGWDPLAKKIHSWVFDSEGGICRRGVDEGRKPVDGEDDGHNA